MTTKTFRAEKIMDALLKVQQELGPDAIVLSVREIPTGPAWQVWRQTGCEIIAMRNDASAQGKQNPIVAAAYQKTAELNHPDGNDRVTPIDNTNLIIKAKSKKEAINQPDPAVQAVFPKADSAKEHTPVSWQPPRLHRQGPDYLPLVQAQEPAAAEKTGQRVDTLEVEQPIPPKVSKISDEILSTLTPLAPKETPLAPSRTASLPLALQHIEQVLLAQGVDASLLHRLITVCTQAFPPAAQTDELRCKNYLKRQLEASLRVLPKTTTYPKGQVICLVGASGSGKTSATARLAAYYTRSQGRKVVWITADTLRTGGVAEAKLYADAIAIPLHPVYTAEELAAVVAAETAADVILVDMPGYNLCKEAEVVELGSFLSALPKRISFLLASATTKEEDLTQALAALGPFAIQGLILTKLDETYSFGSVFNFAWRSQLPLAYFTFGKDIVSDFSLADARKLVATLFGEGGIH